MKKGLPTTSILTQNTNIQPFGPGARALRALPGERARTGPYPCVPATLSLRAPQPYPCVPPTLSVRAHNPSVLQQLAAFLERAHSRGAMGSI